MAFSNVCCCDGAPTYGTRQGLMMTGSRKIRAGGLLTKEDHHNDGMMYLRIVKHNQWLVGDCS